MNKTQAQQDRLTSSWFLYMLAGDPTGYQTAKFLLSKGFVPYIVSPPIRLAGRVIRWKLLRRPSRTTVPLTSPSYRDTLGRRRRGRKTSHMKTQQADTG